MKTFKFISFSLLLFFLIMPLHAQDNTVAPQRTPEQEAAKQTEKLQQELNLSPEQTKQIYEINLRYARERQISNTRSEAMERMKNKNNEIQRVLNQEQNNRLQTKRYERTMQESSSPNRNQPSTPTGYRTPTEYRQTPSMHLPASDMNLRSTYRSTMPSQSGSQAPQTVRRSTQQPSTPTSAPQAAPATRSTQTQQPATRSGSSGTTNSNNTRTQNSAEGRR
jgi:hypothetical protein